MFTTNIPLLTFSFSLDPLSLFFVTVIAMVSIASSIFSINYIREIKNKTLFIFLFVAFIVSMLLVVTIFNAFAFLICWEAMSLISFFLVIFQYEKEENREAGFFYILMTHFGTGFIILSFIWMYMATGSLDFKDWHHAALSESGKFWVFLFALIGFGTKAGIFPLHIWLPRAHPVAPSNVSALMSGVMIKTAIYMLIRFYFDFLPEYAWQYGFTVLCVGSVSALFGVMYALGQHDLKRLLAYHSIENIGIILMGIGLAMVFKSTGHPTMMVFALIGGLYHTLNHAAFKSLLFMGAGSILHATHTRDMEKYGGLIKKMPYTAIFFLIGAISISALPPFNGFVSEWMTYQSLLLSNRVSHETIRIFSPIFASMLALTGAFAATCFVKVFGISFLGKARSPQAEKAREVGVFMSMGMGFLAVLCLILGLFPAQVIGFLDKVAESLTGFSIQDKITFSHGFVLAAVDYNFGRISPLGLTLAGVILAGGVYCLIRIMGARGTRIYETWGCGLSSTDSKAQCTATGFTQPVKKIFPLFYLFQEILDKKEDRPKYFFPEESYHSRIFDVVEVFILKAVQGLTDFLMFFRKFFQVGLIHIYLLYIAGTLMALLAWVVW